MILYYILLKGTLALGSKFWVPPILEIFIFIFFLSLRGPLPCPVTPDPVRQNLRAPHGYKINLFGHKKSKIYVYGVI